MTNKILVPLDGSELAAQVLPHAAALARATHAEIVLMNALVPIETWLEAGGVFESDRRLAEESKAAKAYLEFAKYSLDKMGLTARTILVYGKAADAVRQVAEAEDADLIAMTTHGRSGLPRMVLGSVASEVVRTASRPVYLIHASDHPVAEVEFERILVPLDGSALSESALPVVEDLAQKLGAELILQQVITPPAVLYPGEAIPAALPALVDIEQAAKDYVDEQAWKLRHNGITVTRDVSVGYAADAILKTATDNRVDLIIMSSHGRTGFGRWIMGSVADEVVRRSKVPCLIVRPPAVAHEQPEMAPSAVVEVIDGVAAAKTVLPLPAMSEVEIPTAAAAALPDALARRPRRRIA